MSQITTYPIISGGGTGPVETLTGNTGGPVGPDGSDNINVVAASGGTLLVAGNPGTNTLTISDQGTFVTTVTTVGTATTAFPMTVPVSALSAVVIDAEIVGAKSDFTASLGGYIICAARNSGFGSTVVGTDISFQTDSAGAPSISVAPSGNTIQITVAGVAAETWKWTAYVRYTTQT